LATTSDHHTKTLRPTSSFVALSALTGEAPAADPGAGPPCHLCPARCCKYFALQIDAPTTPRDHDQIRWFLVHEAVVVWVQDGDWYLEIQNRCRHLQPDNRCGIYETRPQICRDYGLPDGEDGPCEFFTQDGVHDLYFDSAEAFDAWSREQLARRERRLARRRQRYQEQRQPLRREATG
jgi:Fe-S-cluster containining protein